VAQASADSFDGDASVDEFGGGGVAELVMLISTPAASQ
jgi:hypothetical protein